MNFSCQFWASAYRKMWEMWIVQRVAIEKYRYNMESYYFVQKDKT